MSNLYKRYLSLKIENSDNFYLFENGIFYIFLDDDAKIMAKALNLKLSNLNSSIVKCGFPTSHLDKYLTRLKNLDYDNVKIVSSSSFLAYSQKDYLTNVDAKKFVKKIANIDSESLSISQAFELINELSVTAKEIVEKIE